MWNNVMDLKLKTKDSGWILYKKRSNCSNFIFKKKQNKYVSTSKNSVTKIHILYWKIVDSFYKNNHI